MFFELRQSIFIEAKRYLPNLPKNHPCSKVHSHNFKITLVLRGNKNNYSGWVIDYQEILNSFEETIKKFKNILLNEIEGLENPTSENMVQWMFENNKEKIPQLYQIILAETESSECRYPVYI